MRPTELSFRSPKEFTPDSYNPSQTFDSRGQKKDFNRTSSTLPKACRFDQYGQRAARLGFRVGPGCYDISQLDITRGRIKHAPLYSQRFNRRASTTGHTAIGNLTIPDEEYFLPKQSLTCTARDLTPAKSPPTTQRRVFVFSHTKKQSDRRVAAALKRSPYLTNMQSPKKRRNSQPDLPLTNFPS